MKELFKRSIEAPFVVIDPMATAGLRPLSVRFQVKVRVMNLKN